MTIFPSNQQIKHKERGAALKRDLAGETKTPLPFSILEYFLYTACNLLSLRISEWYKSRSFEHSLSTQTENKTYKFLQFGNSLLCSYIIPDSE